MMRSTLLAALVSAALPTMALAQSADDLKNDEKSTGDVLVYGMGYSGNRYSPLTQINKQNVSKLVPVWAYSLADLQGGESFSIVKDGVIYVTTHNSTAAVDAKTGKEICSVRSPDPVTHANGYAMTGAPLIVGGVVITGVAGAEFSHRGLLEGYDART